MCRARKKSVLLTTKAGRKQILDVQQFYVDFYINLHVPTYSRAVAIILTIQK